MLVRNMSVCSPCIWLQSTEQPQALLLASITRTVIWLFKVIDMYTLVIRNTPKIQNPS